MPEHRCQYLFPTGWTPPERSPVRAGTAASGYHVALTTGQLTTQSREVGPTPGGTGPTSTIAAMAATVVGIAIVLAVTVVAGWVALSSAWAGGLQ